MKKLVASSVVALAFVACADKPVKQEAAAPTPPPPPAPTKAQATLKAAKGSKVAGTITFSEENGKMVITTAVDGLKKGPHGFHIHEKGDCSAADFASAGGHFNPTQHPHADVKASPRHAGDLGNLVADKKNKAHTSLTVEGLVLNGTDGIIGKAIIIHKDKDDGKTQPTGKSGDRLACGVIEALAPTPSEVPVPEATATPAPK